MERKQHIPVFIGCAVLLLLLPTVVFVLFFSPKDVSANHSGSQRVFGATYMTMNNPYYQELDALLRSNIEARGDVLLTRDPAMDQARQNQEILDLIDAGVEATRLIKERYPQTSVIVLTTFDDNEYVFGALKNGASGYLLKGSGVSELAESIKIAYHGGAMINPNIATKVISQFSHLAKHSTMISVDDRAAQDISKSEWPIIRSVGHGMSNKEIAQALCLSEGTVRNAISSVLYKLNLRDRTQLAIWAVQSGVVNGGVGG